MRLHRLELTAFGPFPGTESVDFDALGAAGLFLLNGPTGAGKSSVLDAVCFALYGEVPGARHGDPAALGSHHAPAAAVPRVTLEASFAGQRLRISRSPKHERPKQRGTGTTTAPASVTLEVHTGDGWQPLTNRMDEAGHEIALRTGMSLAQFCQVVLLPQGEFATFLRANAEERRPLLERLFDTRRFSDVEQWLANRRTELHRSLVDAEARVQAVAARAIEAVGELPGAPAAPDPSDPVDTWQGWLAAAAAAAGEAAGHAEVSLAAAVERQRAARLDNEQARAVADRQRRFHDAQAARRLLAAQTPEQTRRRLRLQRAAAAMPVAVHLDLVDSRLESVAAAERRVKDLRDAARAVAGELPDDAPADDLRDRARQAREELGRLAQLASVAEQLAGARQRIESLDAAEAAGTIQLQQVDAALALVPERRAAAEAAIAAAREAQAVLPTREQDCTTQRARLDAAATRDRLRTERVALGERSERLRLAALTAHESWLALRERRLAGMAAELAGQLRPGEHCPVCGGLDHPSPATATADPVTAGDEQRAHAAYTAADGAAGAALAELAAIDQRLATASAVSGDAPQPELAARLRAAEAERDATRAEAAEAGARLDRLGALTRHESELTTRRTGLAEAAAARTAEHSGLLDRCAQAEATLRAALGPDADLAAARQRRQRLAECCEQLATALAEHARALAEAAQAEQACLDAARTAGFTQAAEARDALVDEAELEALETACREHERAVAEAESWLRDGALAAAAALDPADPAAAEAALHAADAEVAGATAAATTASRRVASLRRLGDALDAALVAWTPVAADHAVAKRLADLVQGTAGDNQLRMRLSAYVLAERLAQVAAAATARLQRMSDGRYSLVHTAERGPGGQRSGLGLRIVDAWSGHQRDPSSLSGGESFLASLALALGLADVVAAEAGGTAMETLFIDEGFGTLDEETLDEVMDTLDGLREGGRAVGIVSHVAELRQRVPTQLRVRKGRRGSTLEQGEPTG